MAEVAELVEAIKEHIAVSAVGAAKAFPAITPVVPASVSQQGHLAGMVSSPIWPLSLLCALICCACGFVAFLVLNAQEQRKDRQQAGGVSAKLAMKTGLNPERVPGEAPISPPNIHDDGRRATPAPDMPNVRTRELPKPILHTEDGTSTIQNEQESLPSESMTLSGGVSFRSPVSMVAAQRGPLTADVPDGERNYVWDDDSEYFGEWRNGCAHGRGVFSWPSGDRYEGEWEEGRESGVGTYIAVDGSTFYGFWTGGKMHGEGVYKPAAADNQRAEVMFMREYNQGRLVKETVLRVKDYDYHRKELKRDQRARKYEKRQAAREMMAAPRSGETIYKGHRSYDLMRNLQMGILFSIAKTNKEVSERELEPRPEDFKTEVTQQFPRSGQSTSFKWKDYCPLIFHRLREAFGIDNRDYLLSLTGDKALRELPSPGKSGSVFFISDDDRFMIKTVRKEEMHMLLELIPTYHTHCLENPDTLLTRFYGVHRVKPINGSHVRFVVMGNVFPTETRLHRKYDLKGSTYGRTAGEKATDPNATLKDLDVDFRLQLKDAYRNQLMRQIQADAALLERMHVMDYSLLLGIHYVDWGTSWYPPHTDLRREPGDQVEGVSPSGSEKQRQQLNWGDEFASAELDASKFSPQKTIFSKWHSQRQSELDSPSPPNGNSMLNSREDDGVTPHTNSELELASPTSSVTTTQSASSTMGISPSRRNRSVGEDLQARYRDSVAINTPSGSWPLVSPTRPSRFALESRGPSGFPPVRSPFATTCPPVSESTTQPSLSLQTIESGQVVSQLSAAPAVEQGNHSTGGQEGVHQDSRPSVDILTPGEAHTPRFLQLLNRVRIRDDRQSLEKSALDRTRSGWLKDQNEGTSLRSLHSEARKNMGVSIPALAFPLKSDGSADTEAKPEPVTLFFGIIDFLQDYNMRKRTEHMLKSIVQDGKKISVTNPHTYSQRFIHHMHTLFVPIPGDGQ